MSYDINKNYFYKRHGKVLRLYKFRKNTLGPVDTQGRVNSSSSDFSYPDEAITDGLRVEYTALTEPFVDEDPESVTDEELSVQGSPTEVTHVNLNRVLSLAVVEYLKAQMAERQGDVKAKEYFMKQFYNKLADNESNKNDVFVAIPSQPYAVR
jgi:hypothetical protein|tara:strand:+ start:3192 stop:3650 length:459 start_codon:yes stop_codon:yes gene_type:complete